MKDSRIQEVKDSSEMPKLLLKMSQLDRGIRVAFGFCIDLNPGGHLNRGRAGFIDMI